MTDFEKFEWKCGFCGTRGPTPECISLLAHLPNCMSARIDGLKMDEKEKTNNVLTTLEQRGRIYGDFNQNAECTQALKAVAEKYYNNSHRPIHKEGIDRIFLKLGRILSGNPDELDNWHDGAGYFTLVEQQLIKELSPYYNSKIG